MSISLVIVDDEEYIRNKISSILNASFNETITIVGEAASIMEGLKVINATQPDIVLLDIELQDGSSFEILKQLHTINFEIIFITGYDDKAIKAIKTGALDYLLKPIDLNEFIIAIQKAIDCHVNKQAQQTNLRTDIASKYYIEDIKEHVMLKTLESVHIVKIESIMYCKSEGSYTTFYIKGAAPIMISKSIKHAEEILTASFFVRCQRSFIVNVKYVVRYLRSGTLILQDETEIPISGRNKEDILNLITSKLK